MSVIEHEAANRVIASTASESWRSWLMTGVRSGPIYRRRVRGANKGLKRMLVEGMTDSGDQTQTWKRFSGAMVRQAVDEAVSSLPPRQKQLIKLAYFSDLSNREIALGLGITLSSVERGLREAIARVSEYVERGKGVGRKAIYAIGLFLAGRQMIRAGVIVVATATAGAVVSAQPTSPAQLVPVERATVPAVTSVQHYIPLQHQVVDVAETTNAVVETQAASGSLKVGGLEVTTPKIDVPAVTLPPLNLPAVNAPPVKQLPPPPPIPPFITNS
jgi:DNA-directed RNA polymerase specialized sigma24 family protein